MEGPLTAIPIYHAPLAGGKHLAFRYLGVPVKGERIMSVRARLLDGSRPFDGDYMYCGTCGEQIHQAGVELVW